MYRQHMECESVSSCEEWPGLKNEVVSDERNGGGLGTGGAQQRPLQKGSIDSCLQTSLLSSQDLSQVGTECTAGRILLLLGKPGNQSD